MPFYLCRRKSTYVRQWLQLPPLRGINNKCVYVCMYVCMHVCMYVCMYKKFDSYVLDSPYCI